MIKAEDGKVAFRGTKIDIIADAVTVLHVLKEGLSEEEYKMVIRLASKSEQQLSDEAKKKKKKTEKMREKLKKLLEL